MSSSIYFRKVIFLRNSRPRDVQIKKGKLESDCEGPFVVENVFSNEVYLLNTMDGNGIILCINSLPKDTTLERIYRSTKDPTRLLQLK